MHILSPLIFATKHHAFRVYAYRYMYISFLALPSMYMNRPQILQAMSSDNGYFHFFSVTKQCCHGAHVLSVAPYSPYPGCCVKNELWG